MEQSLHPVLQAGCLRGPYQLPALFVALANPLVFEDCERSLGLQDIASSEGRSDCPVFCPGLPHILFY
jgi:hypothetical protein